MRVGDQLIAAGKVTPVQVRKALGYQRMFGGKLGEAVIALRFASATDVLQTVADHLRVPYVYIGGRTIHPSLLEQLPRELMARFRILPVRCEAHPDGRATLFVATTDPTNLTLLDTLGQRTRKGIRAVLAAERDLEDALTRHGLLEGGLSAAVVADGPAVEAFTLRRGGVTIH